MPVVSGKLWFMVHGSRFRVWSRGDYGKNRDFDKEKERGC